MVYPLYNSMGRPRLGRSGTCQGIYDVMGFNGRDGDPLVIYPLVISYIAIEAMAIELENGVIFHGEP